MQTDLDTEPTKFRLSSNLAKDTRLRHSENACVSKCSLLGWHPSLALLAPPNSSRVQIRTHMYVEEIVMRTY